MGNQHVTEEDVVDAWVEVMTAAGTHPAFIHAVRELGYMVTEANAHLMTEDMLEEWEITLDQWLADHPGAPPL